MSIQCILHLIVLLLYFTSLALGRRLLRDEGEPEPKAIEIEEEQELGVQKPFSIARVPHQVSLEIDANNQKEYCTGSILESKKILTVAQCACQKFIRPKHITVRAGSNNWHTGGARHSVLEIRCHDKFHSRSEANDIAILFLKDSLEFHGLVAKIPLAEYTPEHGTQALVSTWREKQIEKMFLRTVDRLTCVKTYNSSLPDGIFCAVSSAEDKHEHTCDHFRGGPLISKGQLIGVLASRRNPDEYCTNKNFPHIGIYIDVAHFHDWIQEQTLESPAISHRFDGSHIHIEDVPYQVSLQENGKHYCSGSIISARIILTVARCLFRKEKNNLRVRVGSRYWNKDGQTYRVAEIRWNNRYVSHNHFGDIALLRLHGELVLNRTIAQIPMANEEPENGSLGLVTGWRVFNNGTKDTTDKVEGAYVKVVDRHICQEAWKMAEHVKSITKGMICAAGKKYNACQVDSGGALVIGGELVGITSWGNGCATKTYPRVYVNVVRFKTWIYNQYKDMYLDL